MPSVQDYIDARAPQYSSDARLSSFQSQATLRTGTVYGTLRNEAIALLMLHWLTMDDSRGGGVVGGSGAAGSIAREKEGALERQYTLDFRLSMKYPDLSQTRWGMELIGLRKENIMGPRNRCTE